MAKTPRPDQTAFKIEVREEDIEKAQRNNSYRCVVAQAVARTIPDATRIEIDLQSIRFTRAETGDRLLYLTPNIAAGYVVAFDAGDPVHPFTFRLSSPIKMARRVRTPAGLAVDKAAKKASRSEPKHDVARAAERATVEDAVAGELVVSAPVPDVTSDEVEPAPEAKAAAALKEEYAGAKLSETVSKGVRPRKRTFKTGNRVYGSRILRVNRYLREEGPTT